MFSGIFRAYFDADESDRTNRSSSLFNGNRMESETKIKCLDLFPLLSAFHIIKLINQI